MSRARTNVGEWWEVEYSPGLRNSNMFRRNSGRKKAHEIAREVGGKVYHVTRYRLEPFEVLRWVRMMFGTGHLFDARGDDGKRRATVYDDGQWIIWVCGERRSEGQTTPEAAKAACAARLLELGYRVREQ